MSENVEDVRLLFLCPMDENIEWEIESKGFFDYAAVSLPGHKTVRVHFWDPIRLAQELETDLNLGKSCLAEPAMIIVRHVTVENMTAAINQLYKEGFFDAFVDEPIDGLVHGSFADSSS